MEAISLGNLLERVRNQPDFAGFAESHFGAGGEIYDFVYGEYFEKLNRGSSLDEIVDVCRTLYETMFRINMRMSYYAEIYDEKSIYFIAIQAIERLGDDGFIQGLNKRGLAGLIYRNICRPAPARSDTFLVDCHVHTSERSSCAVHNTHMMAERARESGLDAIFITDHGRLLPQDCVDELNQKYAPLQVFPGIEIRIKDDDFIVLGIYDRLLEGKCWNYPELHSFVRERGGYIAHCHPMRFWGGVPDEIHSLKPDALELYSSNMKKYDPGVKREILQLSNALNIRLLGNSDAHSIHNYCYCNILDKKPGSEAELIQMLKDGAYRLGRVPGAPA